MRTTLTIAVMLAVTSTGIADEDESALLRAENRMLRRTVERLREKIAELEAKLDQATAQPEAAARPTSRQAQRRAPKHQESDGSSPQVVVFGVRRASTTEFMGVSSSVIVADIETTGQPTEDVIWAAISPALGVIAEEGDDVQICEEGELLFARIYQAPSDEQTTDDRLIYRGQVVSETWLRRQYRSTRSDLYALPDNTVVDAGFVLKQEIKALDAELAGRGELRGPPKVGTDMSVIEWLAADEAIVRVTFSEWHDTGRTNDEGRRLVQAVQTGEKVIHLWGIDRSQKHEGVYFHDRPFYCMGQRWYERPGGERIIVESFAVPREPTWEEFVEYCRGGGRLTKWRQDRAGNWHPNTIEPPAGGE
ncbi:MAG: hypothetical protein ACP5HU_00285 [Phycisphaerae bacterium]